MALDQMEISYRPRTLIPSDPSPLTPCGLQEIVVWDRTPVGVVDRPRYGLASVKIMCSTWYIVQGEES